MKENICTVIGVFGGFIAALLGGWDSAMITLVIFMGIDFTTGLITATMGRSKHSKTGKLTLKKKIRKCTIYVKVTSKANKNRKARTKTVKIVVR